MKHRLKIMPQITPSNTTNKNLTWRSSNESIATIDNDGWVRGLSPGTVFITAATVDGDYFATSTFTFFIRDTYNDITQNNEGVIYYNNQHYEKAVDWL